MAVVTRAQFLAAIERRLAGDPKITPTVHRQVLRDLADSTVFMDAFDALVARVAALEAGGPAPVDHINYVGIATTGDFVAADFTVNGEAAALAVPGAPTWPDGERRFIAYARDASLGDFNFVYYYPQGQRVQNNVLGAAFVEGAGMIELGGVPHRWVVTQGSLRDSARGRIVEVG